MSASARMYERLSKIPEDSSDPESLDELLVCAFGAFDRYYVCWKTKGGDYRHDGYDLPSELEEWLFATEGSRDFASLQVVFGRGDEFFASDINGKLENKEPEKKEPPPEELEDKRPMRRSRTISFMRPRSDESQRQILDLESPTPSRRSSLLIGRPPSMSLSLRSNSDASLSSQATLHSRLGSESSISQVWSRPSSIQTADSSQSSADLDFNQEDPTTSASEEEKSSTAAPLPAATQSTRRLRPLSMSFKPQSFPRIPEGKPVSNAESPIQTPPPIPPVPPVSLVEAPLTPSSKLWPSKPYTPSSPTSPPPVMPLRLQRGRPHQGSFSRSAPSPPSLSSRDDSPSSSSINSPTRLSLQIISTAAQTTPVSPTLAPNVSPPPPKLSLTLTTLSTTPILPKPQLPPTSTPRKDPTTTSTATQTTPPLSPLRTALPPLNTTNRTFAFPSHTHSYSTTSSFAELETPQDEEDEGGYFYEPPPVFMGRMMDYYSKPGYQLGDSLSGGYVGRVFEVEGERELDAWERANGRVW